MVSAESLAPAAAPSIGGVPLSPKPLQALGPPEFETLEQERRYRQEQLVAAESERPAAGEPQRRGGDRPLAAAHAQAPHGRAFSSLGRLLDPLNQHSCLFFDDHVLVHEDGGKVVLGEEAGRRFAAAFSDGKAAIQQNHGLFTVAPRWMRPPAPPGRTPLAGWLNVQPLNEQVVETEPDLFD